MTVPPRASQQSPNPQSVVQWNVENGRSSCLSPQYSQQSPARSRTRSFSCASIYTRVPSASKRRAFACSTPMKFMQFTYATYSARSSAESSPSFAFSAS